MVSTRLAQGHPVSEAEGARPEAEPRLPPHPATLLFLAVAQLPLSFPAEGCFQKPGKKSCSDSGSDCGSSSGGVRASRGSWGSWSSGSSSDGDRKPAAGAPRCLPPGKSAAARAGPARPQKAVRPVFALLPFNVCYPFHPLWLCWVFLAAQALL